MSGLQRRESSGRTLKPPPRLEEDDGPVPAMKPAEKFTPSMSGLQRRESSGRTLKPPPRLEEDDPQAVMDRLMEQCRQILKELQTKDVHSIFAAPVDPVALNIPNYLEVIKEPMDLGTIENRMNVNVIESPEEFARLVRLTFTNAIKYNSLPDNAVHQAARAMLTIFNNRFGTIDKAFENAKKNRKLSKAERQELKRKEKEAAKEAKKKAKEEKERKRKAAEDAANESKRMKIESFISTNKATMEAIKGAADSSNKVSRNEFNLLLEMVQGLQDHVIGLHKLVNANKSGGGKSQSSTSTKKTQEKPAQESSTILIDAPMYDEEPHAEEESYDSDYGEPSKPKKKKAKKEPQAVPAPEEVADLSFEEQEALSHAINELPENLLLGAMQIIREADVGYNDDDEEIDLEIDQLDSRTQRRLQKFVAEVRLSRALSKSVSHFVLFSHALTFLSNRMSNKRRRRKGDNLRPLLLLLLHLHQYKLLRKGLMLLSPGLLLLLLEGNLSSPLVTMIVTAMMIMGSKLILRLPMPLPTSRIRMKR